MLRLTAERPVCRETEQGASVDPSPTLCRGQSHVQGRTIVHRNTRRNGGGRFLASQVCAIALFLASGCCLLVAFVELPEHPHHAGIAIVMAVVLWLLGEVAI